MDFEDRLKRLQTLFCYTLSESAAAKARYISLSAQATSTPEAVAWAAMQWQQLERRKTNIIAQMVELEEFEQEALS